MLGQRTQQLAADLHALDAAALVRLSSAIAGLTRRRRVVVGSGGPDLVVVHGLPAIARKSGLSLVDSRESEY